LLGLRISGSTIEWALIKLKIVQIELASIAGGDVDDARVLTR
jgi:hypothetical protein